MRICLISPPTLPEYGDLARIAEVRATAQDAPLGILSLAAVLEGRGIESDVIALNRVFYDYLDTPDKAHVDFCQFAAYQLSSVPADIFGFSTLCNSYPITIRMASELRRLRPQIMIIFGGPQASVVDRETLAAFHWVDAVVRGEGEESLPQLLEGLSGSISLEQVPGITFRLGQKVVRNVDAALIQDLDALPLPAFHRYGDMSDCDYVPLELGRGCPFSCTFCSTNDFFRRRFRLKSPNRMLEQMNMIYQRYGAKNFELVHDMFTVDRKRVGAFCEALLQSRKEFNWSCSARTDCVDEELLELMAEAGCSGIFFGIETASARIQTLIDKGLDLRHARRMIDSAHRAGISTTVSLIAGFPEETVADVKCTVDFFLDVARYDDVETQLHLLAPLAKSPLHSKYRNQLVLDDASGEIARLGWDQNQGDRDLIRSYPEIFPNFYALPTSTDRKYIEELRAFLLTGKSQFRWLLMALRDRSGGIMQVFDDWMCWDSAVSNRSSGQSVIKYYLGSNFPDDFFAFLGSGYLKASLPKDVPALVMLEYEAKWRMAARRLEQMTAQATPLSEQATETQVTLESVPRLTRGVSLVPIGAEAASLIRRFNPDISELRDVISGANQDLLCLQLSGGTRTDVSRLEPLSARLLQLCDGRSTLREISKQFADGGCVKGLETFGLDQICVAGLLNLAAKRLIFFASS